MVSANTIPHSPLTTSSPRSQSIVSRSLHNIHHSSTLLKMKQGLVCSPVDLSDFCWLDMLAQSFWHLITIKCQVIVGWLDKLLLYVIRIGYASISRMNISRSLMHSLEWTISASRNPWTHFPFDTDGWYNMNSFPISHRQSLEHDPIDKSWAQPTTVVKFTQLLWIGSCANDRRYQMGRVTSPTT